MLEGSILQKLETAHQGDKRPLNFGVYYKNTLISLCHALEDFILESDSAPVMIVAFQQGKWYLEEAERYGELANKSSQVAIMATLDTSFAQHPTSQRENVALVGLEPSDPVAQEWHLMILSETYTAMVLCQELSDEDYGIKGPPENDRERKFYGFWTFEPELVKETVELTVAHIGHYDPDLQQTLHNQVQKKIAAFGTKERDDIGAVVNCVVEYLKNGQQDLSQVGENLAEAFLPQEQALDDNLVSNELQAFLRMAQLIDQADAINPNAAAEVTALSEAMGQLLDLPAWQLKRLRLAALLHRLAPLQRVKVQMPPKSNAQKEAVLQAGSLPKASVLRIMPRLQAVAEIITHQTENWNGSGKPEGLAYDAIPLESRILALLADFQLRLNAYQHDQSVENPLLQALTECQAKGREDFDPKLVEVLALMVMGMQQGMSLRAKTPKIAAGVWLLDADQGDN
ncbi:DICT sensory domain-containing protein [Lyngbya aestuarii]|uniref:DICT sensory domain-containing protein n=1 Tax=Lyngbya aestuarii TaxID=118322 RepID=UPI00403E2819